MGIKFDIRKRKERRREYKIIKHIRLMKGILHRVDQISLSISYCGFWRTQKVGDRISSC